MNKLLYDIRNRLVFYCPREEMQIRGGIQKKKVMPILHEEAMTMAILAEFPTLESFLNFSTKVRSY